MEVVGAEVVLHSSLLLCSRWGSVNSKSVNSNVNSQFFMSLNVCTVPTSFLTNSSYLLGFVIYSCSLCAKIKTPTFGFLQEVKC